MRRFYVELELSVGARVALPKETSRHVARALRLVAGDEMVLFNGTGGQYRSRIAEIDEKSVTADVLAFDDPDLELPFAITIGQGLSGGDKMDWTIEKCVEMGAVCVQPLAAERSVIRLSPERAEKRTIHWTHLVQAASSQCGRNRLMRVGAVTDLQAWVAAEPASTLRILLSPDSDRPLASIARPEGAAKIAILIGPEGGFTSAEEKKALQAGFTPASLGPRVLRTETAAMAAIAILTGAWLRP